MEFILAVVALVWVYTVSKRVTSLEEKTKDKTPQPASPQSTMTAVERAAHDVSTSGLKMPVPPSPLVTASSPDTSYDSGEDPVSRFVQWVQKDFMMKVGAFLLLCALGWFVSYAFANDWVGPRGRIALGLLIGAVFMGLGIWRIRTHKHQGGVFMVLGSTMVILTLYAAREIYGFFTPTTALSLMLFSIVFVAFVSVRYESRTLALSGLILASIAPHFTGAPLPDVIELFTYLAVVVFGTLWVVYLRGWSILTLTALVIVFLYGLPHALGGYNEYTPVGAQDIPLLFAFFFTAVFFIANILGLVANENEENRLPHILIAFGTGLYLILWIYGAAEPEWQSLLYVMWMLVFSVGSFLVYRALGDKTPFYIYGGTSIALLAAATASELEGATLTIAYTFEVAILSLLALLLLQRPRVASTLSALFVVPAILSVGSIVSSEWMYGVVHDDFFVLVVLGLVLGVVGYKLHEAAKGGEHTATMGAVLVVGAIVYGLSLIWLVLHSPTVLGWEDATMAALIIYTIIGLAVHMRGVRKNNKELRVGGGILLGLVVLRLITVEVWLMELTGRIITFAAIGLLLIGTAFMRKGKEHKAEVTGVSE